MSFFALSRMESGNCEECETLLSEHMMNEHEPQKVYQHFGRAWVLGNSHKFNGTQDNNYIKMWKVWDKPASRARVGQ